MANESSRHVFTQPSGHPAKRPTNQLRLPASQPASQSPTHNSSNQILPLTVCHTSSPRSPTGRYWPRSCWVDMHANFMPHSLLQPSFAANLACFSAICCSYAVIERERQRTRERERRCTYVMRTQTTRERERDALERLACWGCPLAVWSGCRAL